MREQSYVTFSIFSYIFLPLPGGTVYPASPLFSSCLALGRSRGSESSDYLWLQSELKKQGDCFTFQRPRWKLSSTCVGLSAFPREFFAHDAPLFREEQLGYFLCVVVLGLLPVTPSWHQKLIFIYLHSLLQENFFPLFVLALKPSLQVVNLLWTTYKMQWYNFLFCMFLVLPLWRCLWLAEHIKYLRVYYSSKGTFLSVQFMM